MAKPLIIGSLIKVRDWEGKLLDRRITRLVRTARRFDWGLSHTTWVGCSNRRIMVAVGPNRWLVERQKAKSKSKSKSKSFPLMGDSSKDAFQSLRLQLLWPRSRCLRIARNSFSLTEPSLLSRATQPEDHDDAQLVEISLFDIRMVSF